MPDSESNSSRSATGSPGTPRLSPLPPSGALGCELREGEVNYDRNYDNYGQCGLRYRNYDRSFDAMKWFLCMYTVYYMLI